MDRRRSLLKIAALRSERERQAGVNCTKGYLQSQDAGLLFEGPRTFECFFTYVPSDKMQVIAGFGISMIEIHALTTNQLRVYCGGGNATVDIVPGDSYLVDVAYDGTTAICYLNGAEAARFPVTGYKITDLFKSGSDTYIPQGSLVFCRHYNYAISAEEVAALYNDGDPAGYILPQNLKNIKNIAFTSKTFEFDMDSPYYGRILESSQLESGRRYRVDYVVEEWDIAPYVMVTCGISCGVTAVAGNQYWNNLSAAKLGENQYVVVDTKKTGIPFMFVYGSDPAYPHTSRRLKVTVHSVKMLGCVAEYLPQNLVGSPHGDPVEIVGKNSYTWTGVDDPVSFDIKINRVLSVGGAFRITGSVSNYKSGTPYLNLGHNSIAYLPKDNSPFTLVVTLKGGSSTLLPYIYIYGGSSSEDKQLTITVDSIEPVSDVALSWLDSANQLPLNDEYLPPLFESIVIGDATPIHITGENSYTWTGADDRTYGKLILISRTLNVGSWYRISVTVSDYEAGSPFINISGTDSASIPGANGTYELDLAYTADYPNRIILYGGPSGTDRRLTLTVNSIEPIVEHSYDLIANGTPQIIIK